MTKLWNPTGFAGPRPPAAAPTWSLKHRRPRPTSRRLAMDRAQEYPDPFGEALSHSSSRAAQMISLAAAAAEVAARRVALRNARQAARDEQARRALQDAERAARERTRVRWAPAHDARWLAQADLLQVAGIWGAAAAYAGDDPGAAAALRKSEER